MIEQTDYDIKLQRLIDGETLMLVSLLSSIKRRKAIGETKDIYLDLEVCRHLIESIKFRKECQEGLQVCKEARVKLKETKEYILDVAERIEKCKVCTRLNHLCKRHILKEDKEAWKKKYGNRTPQEVWSEHE